MAGRPAAPVCPRPSLARRRHGDAAVLGPISRERLSPQQWAWLEGEPRQGPLAHGFVNDQRWTLGRMKTLIGRLFHVGYTVEGTSKLTRPLDWSAQIPVHQAIERNETAVAVWKAEM